MQAGVIAVGSASDRPPSYAEQVTPPSRRRTTESHGLGMLGQHCAQRRFDVVMSADSPDGRNPSSSREDSKFLDKARELLHKRLKVVVKDGRILVGDFLCIDKQGNLILGNTYQQVSSENELSSERLIGQVLVPATQRKSCHVEVMPSEMQRMSELMPTLSLQ